MEAERDLADDAHWKRIQQNTFTRWVNEHLKVVDMCIMNLETDLSDGLRLIALIEVLSQKRIPKYNKRPTFRSQKLENVSVALQFLENERIKIVNIDSSDIVDCKLKLILGLIWTLILHYSISMPVWDGEDDEQTNGVGQTPKQRLLNWINTKVPQLRVNNFTNDWTSGKAVGALVDACAPGLCPDWEMWNPKAGLENATEAMGLADNWLDVRQLITPEEIINPNIDEQSMMTYLSQYPNAKLKEGAPVRPKSNISNIKVYGPGVEPEGVVAGQPTNFIVETFSLSKGNLDVRVLNFNGHTEKANIVFNNDKTSTYTVAYTPKSEGPYRIFVKFYGIEVPGSPFDVKVGSSSKVTVSGPGIQNEVVMNKPTYFNITAKEGVRTIPELVIIDTVTGKTVDLETWNLKLRETNDGIWRCEYTPKHTSVGLHQVNVVYGGNMVKGSPFALKVVPNQDARKVRASGRGLQPRGVRVNDDALFKIYTEGAGEGVVEVNVMGPGGVIEHAKIKKIDATTYEVRYTPTKEGRYIILVTYDGQEIPKCPFEVTVGPYKKSSIIAHGPGLSSGVVGYPASFVIETNGETGALGFTIAGPSQAEIECHDNGDGSALVKYHPVAAGEYAVHILCDDEDIPKSPFIAYIQPSADFKPENVKVYGPVLQKKETTVNELSTFTVDTSQSGEADLVIAIHDVLGNEIPVSVIENSDGTKTCTFTPLADVPHTIEVNYGGVAVQNSPFRVYVEPKEETIDVTKVKIVDLESSVVQKVQTEFTVDFSALGEVDVKKLTCSVIDPTGNIVPSKIVGEPQQGSYRISYTPLEQGQHNVELLYSNIPINGTPFIVNVQSGCDPSKCKAYGSGLKNGVTNKLSKFTVETKEAGTGGLSIAIEGPSEAKMTCTDNRDGSCDVEYLPTEPGEYDVTIRFADKHIPGSPFKVVVEQGADPTKVQVYGPAVEYGEVKEGVPTYFEMDVSAAGAGKIAVNIHSTDGQVLDTLNVEEIGNGIYRVHFLPPKQGTVLEAAITFADQPVPCSPFVVTVFAKPDEKEFEVVHKKENVVYSASLPAEFQIQQRSTDTHELLVLVENPKGRFIKPKLEKKKNGILTVIFTPDEFGDYKIHVKRDGKQLNGSPFVLSITPVGDATKCKFVEVVPDTQLVGKKNKFKVDTKEAGEGAVTCTIVSEHGNEVDVEVIEKHRIYEVSYILEEAGVYNVDLKYGGQSVPNGTFTIKATTKVEEISRVSETRYTETKKQALETHITEQYEEQYTLHKKSEVKYRTVTLEKVPLPSTGGKVVADVRMPSGKFDKPLIEDNRDGTVSVKYDPKEEGVHELAVKYNGEHVQGSPYKFHVDSIASGYLTAYGPGLTHGVSGEPCNFTISTKGSGAGGLSLAVEGPSKADISYHDNKDGTVSVTYLPTAPGEYKISVRFGDKNISGSPFFAKITGEGRKRNQISVGSCSEVTLPGAISDADLRALNASIQAPSGLEEPCFLKRMPTGNIGISFTPREVGEHNVSVKRMGKHIQNSPFKVNVAEREVGDAKKVKVTGASLKEGHTHIENHFGVDTRNAGYGGLSLSIEGPSKAEIVCSDKDDGTLDISYKPTEPGYYIINLKFADHHVDGSPFTVKVTGEGSNRQREKIQKQREAVPITEVGSQCKLTFKMPGITSFDLAACVTSPGDVSEDAEIQEVEDGLYAVHFVPKELGIHTVSVRYKDMHIPGSPFQFTVGPLRDFGAHLVKAGGRGLERGEVGVPSEFNVWTREAGAGSLAISVEGPSKAEIEFKDRKDGSCDVSYSVSEPGEYRVGLKFNDRHIPDSPYKVYITPAVGDAHKLEVQQFPVGAIQADTPAQFMVRKNGAKGELDAKVVAPSNTEDDCFIQLVDPDNYSVRFYPRENGIHAIHVKFNGVHIPGSPFRIKVGKDVADPACVHATGTGLEEVRTGHKADFIINTCNAGAGSLAVTMDGPSKVSMDCTEVEEGYKVRYTPLLPGDYYASIKYNNMHIVGSPFRILCRGEKLADEGAQETSSVIVETVPKIAKTGKNANVILPHFKSDASKVTSKGMGLKKAYLGKQNQFTVSATDAGTNILYVGIHGPKGACDEVFIKHTGRNNYTVNYLVRDRGEYILIIKWGDDHIPGSPYKIDV